MKALDRAELFEQMPVKRAVLQQIAPAIISQMIALVYNLADTYFVGLLNQPAQTAAITIAYSPFLMLTAISNLFGVGGASVLSRALGAKDGERAKATAAISFWLGTVAALLYSLLFFVLAHPILVLCGAKAATYEIAFGYAKWMIIFGGVGTVWNILLANLVRAEGSAAKASFGVSLGGIVNILLDPLFVLPQFLGLGAMGAGIATAISNMVAALYLMGYIVRSRTTALCLYPKYLSRSRELIRPILAVGFPSALQYALTVVAVAAQARFVAQYPTEAIAGLGITKKLDQLPLYFAIGVANGMMPFLAYNHASGNQERRKKAFRFGTGVAVGFACLCLILYELCAPTLVSLFINDPTTVSYGASFLRRMVTAMPLMAFCYPMIIQFQAMGCAREALICSILRKGVLDIPLLFLMDGLLQLYGCMWVQPIVDGTSLIVAWMLYRKVNRQLADKE